MHHGNGGKTGSNKNHVKGDTPIIHILNPLLSQKNRKQQESFHTGGKHFNPLLTTPLPTKPGGRAPFFQHGGYNPIISRVTMLFSRAIFSALLWSTQLNDNYQVGEISLEMHVHNNNNNNGYF